ncbi:MAG: hypothetical protein ABJC64_01070, partial [Paracoccaceae bacterium]
IHDFDPDVDVLQFYLDSSIEADNVTLASSDVAGSVTFVVSFEGDPVIVIPVGTSGTVVTLGNIDVIDIAAP